MTLEEMLELEAPEGASFFTLNPDYWLKYEGLFLFGISMTADVNENYWQRVEAISPVRSLHNDPELRALREKNNERESAQG